jgi:HEAT repeat protein
LQPGMCSNPDYGAWLVGSINRYREEKADREQYPRAVRLLNARTLGPLRTAMKSPDTRTSASAALRDMGPDAAAAVSELAAGLREGEGSISWNCADALGNIGPASVTAIHELVEVLQTVTPLPPWGGESSLRPKVIEALGKIGPDARAAVTVLEQVSQDGTDKESEEAFLALQRIRCTEEMERPTWRTAIPRRRP